MNKEQIGQVEIIQYINGHIKCKWSKLLLKMQTDTKQKLTICCFQEHNNYMSLNIRQVNSKKQQNIYHKNTKFKYACVAILIDNKIDLAVKKKKHIRLYVLS